MNLLVSKMPNGDVKISLAAARGQKPMVVILTPERIESVVKMLELAAKMKDFDFSMEL